MSAEQDDKIDKILGHVEKLSRGMYGDPDNGVKGLIKDNQDQEERIKSLEELKKKGVYMIAGVTLTWPIIWHYIKTFFGF